MKIDRIIERILLKYGKLFTDKIYLKMLFKIHMGRPLNLKQPKTFNEKLQWLKLYNRKPEYTKLVDKIEVKDWVSGKIGSDYVIPTFGVWDSPDEIEISKLPNSFVLKCNHAGGNQGIFIVNNISNFDFTVASKQLKKVLRLSVYDIYREWPYKNIKRRVFIEQNLGDNIEDYKFFCYNGYAESVMVCCDRGSGNTKFYFFDKKWQLKRYNIRGKEAPKDFTIPKPENLDKMFEIASTLSKGFPFVRVDLYNINGKIYFGEMTFFPASGLDENLLTETDLLFGSLIKL